MNAIDNGDVVVVTTAAIVSVNVNANVNANASSNVGGLAIDLLHTEVMAIVTIFSVGVGDARAVVRSIGQGYDCDCDFVHVYDDPKTVAVVDAILPPTPNHAFFLLHRHPPWRASLDLFYLSTLPIKSYLPMCVFVCLCVCVCHK